MRSACFTGHRVLNGNISGLENALLAKLEKMITEEDYSTFYAGGAVGWDTLAAEAVLKLREKYPTVSLCLVLPCPAEEQTMKWNRSQRRRFMDILMQADKTEYISDRYTDTCMKERNRRLVELSDCCICYWNRSRRHSGTAQTVRMAEKKNIPVINLYVHDKDGK